MPTCPQRVSGMFCLYSNDGPVRNFSAALKSDTRMFASTFRAMLDQGINLAPARFESGFMSIAHSLEDLYRTIEAARKFFATYR